MEKHFKINKPHKVREFIKSSGFVPIVLFVFLCAVYAVSSFYSSPAPMIDSISPEIGYPGDVLEIKGQHFGTPDTKISRSIIKPSGSAVYIARARLVLSDFIYWSDEKIRVKIPQEIESGPLWVENKNGTSNDVIFTNRNEIPQIISGPVDPGQPYISTVDPLSGGVGDVITINGMNFGLERENANVLFTLTAPVNINRTEAAATNPAIKSSNLDFDYISWTDNEIRIKVPDGSTSGKMWIDTDRGVSNSIYFELDEKTGTKSYEQKRGYQIKYDVNVNVLSGADDNSLAFWIPGLTDTPEQRNIEYERNITPELENYNGTMLYRFFNLRDGDKKSIQHTVWFERYEVKTRVNTKKVTWNYDEDSKFFKEYTKSDDLIKVDDERIAAIYKGISRSSNPYLKARLIYNFVRKMKFAYSPGGKDVIDNFQRSLGDSYTYALLFTTLARKAGLPSRPVAGYLIYDDKKTVKHFWSEFYINNYGWIPVDPALGDGAKFGDIPEVENPGDYYFGNLDSRHISFSKGVTSIPFIAPYGKTVYKNKMYSLQKSYEEVSGNIGSYKSDWNDIKIIEWW